MGNLALFFHVAILNVRGSSASTPVAEELSIPAAFRGLCYG